MARTIQSRRFRGRTIVRKQRWRRGYRAQKFRRHHEDDKILDSKLAQNQMLQRLFNFNTQKNGQPLSKGQKFKAAVLENKKKLAPIIQAKKKTLVVKKPQRETLAQIYQRAKAKQSNKPNTIAQKSARSNASKLRGGEVMIDTSTKQSKVNKVGQDMSQEFCCIFCNNRKVMDAVRSNDTHKLQSLLNDLQNISNPFQARDCFEKDLNALKLADQLKNFKAVELLVKELGKERDRKDTPLSLLNKYDGGCRGYYDFNHDIAEVHQARGSKEGNDAFILDDSLRFGAENKRKYLKKSLYSLQTLKIFVNDQTSSSQNENQIYDDLSNKVSEYVRKGMIKEAHLILKYMFENGLSDLNRLYHLCLEQSPPDRIVRISVTKQAKFQDMLSPLHVACINPNPKILQALLKVAPTFSLPDAQRRNLVHYAVANENPAVLQFLLQNGCDPNELDNWRRTPLMLAAELGKVQNIKVLLEHYDKKKKEREQAKKERELLKKKNKRKAPQKKRGKRNDSDDEDDDDEDMSGEESDCDGQDINIDCVNMKDRSSQTALHYASQAGQFLSVKILIEAGADVHAKNSKSMTPVLLAAAYGHLDVLKLLEKNDADLDGKVHKQKKNVLIFAAMNGHEDIVKYCLTKERVELSDSSKNTPLHYAAGYGWPNIVKILIDYGANLNSKNLWNTTPASLALQKGHFLILKQLIKANKGNQVGDQFVDDQGRDIIVQNLKHFNSNTISHLHALVKLFESVDIKPSLTDLNGYNAFHYLAGVTVFEIAQGEASREIDSQEERNQKNATKALGDDDGDEKSDSDGDDDNDDKMEEAKNDDEENLSEEAKLQLKIEQKYQQLSEHIVEVAEFLAEVDYYINQQANNNMTPLMVAVKQRNFIFAKWIYNNHLVPLVISLRFNFIQVFQTRFQKRNFLHFLADSIMNIENDIERQSLSEFLEKVQGVEPQDLTNLSKQEDARGFVPLLYALANCQRVHVRDYSNQVNLKSLIQLFQYFKTIKYSFKDIVYEEYYEDKSAFDKDELAYEKDKDGDNAEQIQILFTQGADESSDLFEISLQKKLFKKTGLIDHRQLNTLPNCSLRKSNWLHFLARILLNRTNDKDFAELMDFIEAFNFSKLSDQILEEDSQGLTPLILAFPCERLFNFFLSKINPSKLLQTIHKAFKNGPTVYLHLLYRVNDKNLLKMILKQLIPTEIFTEDENKNTLLHYAAYFRNTHLVRELMTVYSQGNLKSNLQNDSQLFTPLNLAVMSSSKAMELPEIEELIMSKIKSLPSLLTRKRKTVFEQALIAGSRKNNDPINLIKVLMNHCGIYQSCELINSNGDNILHIAARLESIPLSLSYIYQGMDKKQKNSQNYFKNNALSEAIIHQNNQTALFFLQEGSIEIQQNAFVYKERPKLDHTKIVLFSQDEQKNQVPTKEVAQKYIIKKENLQKLALKKNFMGIYYLNQSKDSAMEILIAALQSGNFVLFNQLLPTFDKKKVAAYSNSNGENVMHALAASLRYPELAKEEKENEEDNQEILNEDEDEEMNEENKSAKDRDIKERHVQEIFAMLTNVYQMDPLPQKKTDISTLNIALENLNFKYLALCFKQMQSMQPATVCAYFIQTFQPNNQSFVNLIFSSKLGLNEQSQIFLLEQIKKLVPQIIQKIPEIVDNSLDLQSRVENYQIGPFQKGIRQIMDEITQIGKARFTWNFMTELVGGQKYKVISYLLENGLNISNPMFQHLIPMAIVLRDLKALKLLIKNSSNIDSLSAEMKKQLRELATTDVQCAGMPHQVANRSFLKFLIDNSKSLYQFPEVKLAMKEKDQKMVISKEVKSKNQPFNSIKHIDNIFPALYKDELNQNIQWSDSKPSLIDEVSGMRETHEIYENFNVYLQKAEVQSGLYGVFRFYTMQLLKSQIDDNFTLWTHWGSIGERGQNQKTPFLKDVVAATKEFTKIFKQKTGYDFAGIEQQIKQNPQQVIEQKPKKYRTIVIGSVEPSNKVKTQYKKIKKLLESQDLEALFKVQIQAYKANEAEQKVASFFAECIKQVLSKQLKANSDSRQFNGMLKQDHLVEAQKILEKAIELSGKLQDHQNKLDKEEKIEISQQLLNLSNQYYSMIPSSHQSLNEMKPLLRKYKIERELEKMQQIYNFATTFKLAMVAIKQKAPIEYMRGMLPIKVKPVEIYQGKNKMISDKVKLIMRYLNASNPFQDYDRKQRITLNNILACDESGVRDANEQEVFSNLHNHMLLWHGTKNENLIGILQKGMRIKPIGVQEVGSLFGEAIYFADQAKKAIEYCSIDESDEPGTKFYLLLCEVALGNISNFPYSWDDYIKRPPEGAHSVRIMASHGPDFAHSIIDESGVLVPQGPVEKYPPPKIQAKGQVYKDVKNFAEYLAKEIKKEKQAKKNSSMKSKPKKKNLKKKAQDSDEDEDEDMDSESEQESEKEDEDFEKEDLEEVQLKKLEKSFLNIKERRYDLEPHIVTADYMMGKFRKEVEDISEDNMYDERAQYMVYSHKQVRLRYILEFTRNQ